VLAHLEGLNHSYIHADANIEQAVEIIENAKLRRTGVCGATETVLVDTKLAATALPALTAKLGERCELRGDARACAIIPDIKAATEADFATEHLAAILNIAVVDGLQEALAHIAEYGSGHTDAILTENTEAANTFLNSVDSAIVLHNASTQYADGGEFGFGARAGLRELRLDEIWWLVSPQNPLKPEQPSWESRANTVRNLPLPPNMRVSDVELKYRTQYTVDLIHTLQIREPHLDFVFMMGADNLLQLPKWLEWQSIIETIPIAVIARPGSPIRARLGQAARQYATARIPETQAHTLKHRNAPAWTYLTLPLDKRSSSAIRASSKGASN